MIGSSELPVLPNKISAIRGLEYDSTSLYLTHCIYLNLKILVLCKYDYMQKSLEPECLCLNFDVVTYHLNELRKFIKFLCTSGFLSMRGRKVNNLKKLSVI